MDLDEGGPKSNRNIYKFSHLYHKYRKYLQLLFQPLFKRESSNPVFRKVQFLIFFFFTFCKELFWLMTIADCPLLSQSASGLNFYDNTGSASEQSAIGAVRQRSKTSASGITMTPLVYLMMMPSYDLLYIIINANDQLSVRTITPLPALDQ
jgi:hypothetical protein